jgi:hypothetical protein
MIPAHTSDLVENNAVAQAEHSASVLIDDLVNRLENPGATPAIWKHLDVEYETSILVVRAQRSHDLVLALNLDQLPWLQPQGLGLLARTGALEEWVGEAIGNTQSAWQFTAQCLELVEQEDEQAADHEQRPVVA